MWCTFLVESFFQTRPKLFYVPCGVGWLKEMWRQNQKYEVMRKVSGFTEDDLHTLRLPIRLPERAAIALYHKIATVCRELRKNRSFLCQRYVLTNSYFICLRVCMYGLQVADTQRAAEISVPSADPTVRN